MAKLYQQPVAKDVTGRPDWNLLEKSEVSKELEAILNHRDKSALKNLISQTNKWKATRKDLLV